eukprot:TRINITY_DN7687_c0_g1_i1.p1 TRINITY_DN7687_c0_g1~~TRINITY_DN7687_c0_g1_i1.p1  ORF type:complete len:889 (+),score=113.54 TRINITY_DN7687_c0_g1_i1:190-2856(+)
MINLILKRLRAIMLSCVRLRYVQKRCFRNRTLLLSPCRVNLEGCFSSVVGQRFSSSNTKELHPPHDQLDTKTIAKQPSKTKFRRNEKVFNLYNVPPKIKTPFLNITADTLHLSVMESIENYVSHRKIIREFLQKVVRGVKPLPETCDVVTRLEKNLLRKCELMRYLVMENIEMKVENLAFLFIEMNKTNDHRLYYMINKVITQYSIDSPYRDSKIQLALDLISILLSMSTFDDVKLVTLLYDNNIAPNAMIFNKMITNYKKKKDYDNANKTFDIMIKENVIPNMITYTFMVEVYHFLQDKNVEDIFEFIRMYKQEPDTPLFNKFIHISLLNEDIQMALEYLNKIKLHNLEPTVYSFTPIMNYYVNKGEIENAFEIMKTVKELNLNASPIIYSILIDIKNMDTEESTLQSYAIQLIGKMKENNIVPDAMFVYQILNIFKNEDMEQFKHGYLDSIARSKLFEFDIEFMNGVIESSKSTKDITKYLETFKKHNVKPNTDTYNIILNLCITLADHILFKRTLRKISEYNIGTVHACLKFLCVTPKSKVLNLERLLQDYLGENSKLEPNIVTYGLVFQSLRQNVHISKNMNSDDIAIEQYSRMLKKFIPTSKIIQDMINILCYSGNQDAVKYFKHYSKYGIAPTKWCYSSLARMFAQKNNLHYAEIYFNKYLEEGYTPNDQLLIEMGKMYSRGRNIEKATNLFHQIEKKNLEAFEFVIEGYVYTRNAGKAVQHYQSMIKLGITPGISILNKLIRCFANMNDVESAELYYQIILETKLIPSVHTYETMIDLHIKDNNLQKSFYYFEKLLSSSVKIYNQTRIMNKMLQASLISGDLERAQDVYNRTIKDNVANRVTFELMIEKRGMKDLKSVAYLMQLQGYPISPTIRSIINEEK